MPKRSKSNPAKKRHVFISYSRKDEDKAQEFAKELKRKLIRDGVDVWMDEEGIEFGTPDWEESIRKAIENAFALVLVASPTVPGSRYIKAELDLAESQNCPIFPVWFRGDTWINCVPLRFGSSQYVDCRKDKHDVGINKTIQTMQEEMMKHLPKHFLTNNPEDIHRFYRKGYISIGKARSSRKILIHPDSYSTIFELLNEVYINYLQDQYRPYAYGQDWVLGSPSLEYAVNFNDRKKYNYNVLLVPWNWLATRNVLSSLNTLDENWINNSPKSCLSSNWPLWRGSHFQIVDRFSDKTVFGLTTSVSYLANDLLNGNIKSILYLDTLRDFKIEEIGAVDPKSYKYSYVIVSSGNNIMNTNIKDKILIVDDAENLIDRLFGNKY